jgi:undecaprenyl diphosphate synthase
MELGVSMATVYAFSTENWQRTDSEVTALMTIFAKYADTFRQEALKRNVRVQILATEAERLPPKVRLCVQALQTETAHCTAFTLNLCLSYGGRSEIVQAAQAVARQVAAGSLAVEDVDEQVFAGNLLTRTCPDPDLLLRTSGECRLSNFLLWQCAYAELFFVDKYWPQLTRQDLVQVLRQFAARGRRYGH